MVKITFQSVAGQKVEKDNDKSEVLIPHAAVSELLPGPRGPCSRLPVIWGGGVLAGSIAIWTQTKHAKRCASASSVH